MQFTGFKLFYKNDTKLNWQNVYTGRADAVYRGPVYRAVDHQVESNPTSQCACSISLQIPCLFQNSHSVHTTCPFIDLYSRQFMSIPFTKHCTFHLPGLIRTSHAIFDLQPWMCGSKKLNLKHRILEIMVTFLSRSLQKGQFSLESKAKDHYYFAITAYPILQNAWGFSLDGPLLSIILARDNLSHLPMLVGTFGKEL